MEEELGETKRQLTDAKKVVGEQTAPVKKQEISPVKKSAETIVVVYLPKKIDGGGPNDGSAPGPLASILRSVELERVVKPEMEQRLLNVQLTLPKGNRDIMWENDRKWRQVLNQYLVDRVTMYSINRSGY